MRSIKTIRNLKNKRVVVRVDFNVPISHGKITDNFRIKKGIPTIKYLISRGALVTILMHLGKDGSSDILPVIKEFFRLSKLPKKQIKFEKNVRDFSGEEENNKNLAKKFAASQDLYVNDAFSVAHRTHSSVVGIPKFIPSYAGLQLEAEIKNLSKVFKSPKHPFLFILGGAKFSTKMPLIKKYLKLADHVFVGGALANDFLEAKGYNVGRSLVDDTVSVPKTILNHQKVLLPIDVLVKNKNNFLEIKTVKDVQELDTVIDVGPETIKMLEQIIKNSKLILWNGPLGKYEDGGSKGTESILRLVSKSKAESIIGGGDTAALVEKLKLEKKFTFVSTGGGATLDFLANGTLPGIKALG